MGKKHRRVQTAHCVPLLWLALNGEMQERLPFCSRERRGDYQLGCRLVP